MRRTTLEGWRQAWQAVGTALDEVEAAGSGAFERLITIRGVELTVGDALARSVAHVAYHTGQIVLMARAFAGEQWQSPSIAKGQSIAYAKNPTREKGVDDK